MKMIRLATLNKLGNPETSVQVNKVIATMQQNPIDILCCRETYPQETNQYEKVCSVAKSLEMTYMFTSIKNSSADDPRKKKAVTGLVILTGKQSWMLNSGSLSLLEGKEEKRQAQFAIIRINGTSLIVVNAHFCDEDKAFEKQVQKLIDPLFLFRKGAQTYSSNGSNALGEQYGALLLNSNISSLLSKNAIAKIASERDLVLHESSRKKGQDASLLVMTPRHCPITKVKRGHATTLPHEYGQVTDIEVQRLPRAQRTKCYLPLSFRERWLGAEGRLLAS